ncbi:MAG: hypothetical protein KGI38_06530 [Thaumarchaeota archaeon]|nr:hypothetical protein [Nitrososphaerota archaeon]
MTLKAALNSRPVIYEIVPPRRDTSRFSTELRGVEDVLQDDRIAAINIPELINRREERGVVYSPATIPPEEYAMMIKDYKESIVNLIAPRLEREAFLLRARKVLHEYKIPNLVLVGRERRGDILPGPEVTEGLKLLAAEKGKSTTLGGICIFSRESSGVADGGTKVKKLPEQRRVWSKAEAGCDFVTSQIIFDPNPALNFLRAYGKLCEETGRDPLTVFISLTTIPSTSILSLLDSLDVVVPETVRKRLSTSSDMGRESLRIAEEIFHQVVSEAEKDAIRVPLGLQIEQVGVNSGELSLELLDATYPTIRK